MSKIKIYEAGEQLNRVANALEEILRLVKADQAKTAERYKEYDKESEDPFIKTMEAGERE
jgi:hypothetical protein